MKTKLIGLVLVVAGAGLLYFGWQEKEGAASVLKETFTGNPTDKAMYMLIGGAVCVVAGIGLGAFGGRKPKK